MATRTFRVPNISCGHCVMTIQRELGDLAGVTSVRAEQDTKMVTVEWRESETNWEAIRGLLHEINYPPES